MENAVVAPLLIAPAVPIDPIMLLLADKRSEATRRGYAADLRHFFAFIAECISVLFLPGTEGSALHAERHPL
jgi:hypothetical protein